MLCAAMSHEGGARVI